MTEPTRVAADLSDEALFSDHPGQHSVVPANVTQQIKDAVETAFRIMRSANLSPAYGFDQDDANRTWPLKLGRHGPQAIMAAAAEWIDSKQPFPTLAEFAEVVEAVAAEMRRKEPPPRAPGNVCPECFDSPGSWVFTSDPTVPGRTDTVRPCSLCRPVAAEMHEAGHFLPRTGALSCQCHHPECPDQKRRAKAKAA